MYPRQDDVSLLQRYINDAKLEEKGVPMTDLRRLEGTDQVMLGVDGTKVIDLITQAVREKEKMAIYTYTTPFTVYDKITDVCNTFHSIKNCTPVLVFNGIPFYPDLSDENCRDKNMVPPEIAVLSGTDSSRLCNMNSMRALDMQKKSAARFFVEEDVENQIVKLFRSEFKDTMRAPYLAWAQLSAFCHPKNHHVSEVYGCLELLAFPGIDRVITNINVMKGTFDVVRKSRLLESLRISEDDLGSLIMVDSRNRIMRTVAPKFSSFDDMCKKITRLNDLSLGASYAQQIYQETMHQSEQNRSRSANMRSSALRNLAALACPVLTLVSPYCTLLTLLYESRRQLPLDLKMVMGCPLPPVMYYMFTAGLLSPSLFAALCQGSLVDDWPLVDSIKYRDVAETVLPLRVQTLHQLASSLRLTDFGMTWFRRYNVLSSRINKINLPPGIGLDSWNLTGVTISENLFLVDVMDFAHLAVSSRHIVYTTVEETCAAVLLQSLDLLGYLTHETHDDGIGSQVSEPSSFGRALKMCSVPTLSEYVVLLIELARTGSLTTDSFRMTSEEIPSRDIPREVILASRILSIIPLNVSSAWAGPIDPQLAAFSMISRMVSRSVRHLLEAMLAMIFYQARTLVPLHRMCAIQQGLPFSTPVEFGGGVLAQYILMKENCSLNDVEKAFPGCSFLRHDLVTLFYFWDLAVCVLSSISCRDPLIDMVYLQRANERMKDLQGRLNVNTGMREAY
ncbi:viral life cyclerelated protein [Trypanosoma rangeli]|uniref:Viral life cyclerelated protein n=1 Tax=Trypanosoma rangeli TaxID=5698 RepID=A0A3R7MIQ4_TRYRA|nr:viral life cyclerelated protein [Trypanosoma rangeli]RNF06652.1 viral life cyclerelated protein [Trypanosoma rangeli]|eukprot:RNF06652.1 viral life cyclerelated protein [Trypanosoma rangeli]